MESIEKIRKMSVEEMAEMIDKIDCTGGVLDKICKPVNPERNCSDENINCVKCIKSGLKARRFKCLVS